MTFLKQLKTILLIKKLQLLGILFISIISLFYLSKIFAVKFVDEEDNLILGHFLLQGQKLYSDLFSHHQPLAYLLSATIQLVENPQNIYELIKLHREFMVGYAFFWTLILIWKFGEKVIVPIVIFEASKFYILGNLFLSESLVVYPILYLTLFLFENKQIYRTWEYIILGILIGVSGLLLAPVWPFLACYLGFLIWFKRVRVKEFALIVAGLLIAILIVLPFINISAYFNNTFYINFKYYIPQSAEEKLPWSILKAIASPVTAIIISGGFGTSGLVLKVTGVFFFAACWHLVKSRKFRLLIIGITLLTLSNLRYYSPGLELSAGFHLLVWYSLFILVSFYFFFEFIQDSKGKGRKLLFSSLLVLGVLLILFSSRSLFKINDPQKDYQANYLKQYEFGEAIKVMRESNDTLFVIPDEWLLYFQGDVKNNNRMVNFYGWMSLVWQLNDPVVEKFRTNPPIFFYCDCEEPVVLSYSEDYHQLMRNGAKTPLWILKNKFNNLNEEQKNKLRQLNFQLE